MGLITVQIDAERIAPLQLAEADKARPGRCDRDEKRPKLDPKATEGDTHSRGELLK